MNTKHYTGEIADWENAGYPVEGETKTGNSTKMVSWHGAWRASTICQFARRIASITGCLVVLMNILAFRNLVCESRP